MSLESIDQVNVGDWLICLRGQMLPPRSSIWGTIEPGLKPERNRATEGTLFHVQAVCAPIIFGEWFLLDGKAPAKLPLNWDYVEWGKADMKYVETYLTAFKFGQSIIAKSTVDPDFEAWYRKNFQKKNPPELGGPK